MSVHSNQVAHGDLTGVGRDSLPIRDADGLLFIV